MLRDLGAALADSGFAPEALDATLRAFAEHTGRKLGQVAQPLRAALTGSTASPGSTPRCGAGPRRNAEPPCSGCKSKFVPID